MASSEHTEPDASAAPRGQRPVEGSDAAGRRASGAAPAVTAEEAARQARSIGRSRALLWMLVVLSLFVAVRLPLFSFPMGQQAGMAAYVGRRWVAGEVAYKAAWDYQMPATYVMAGAIIRVLGPSAARCRVAMMAIDLAAALLVYYFVRHWRNRTEAVAAAGLCAFFGGAILVQGGCLGAEHPMAFCIVLAMFAALHSKGRRAMWVAVSGLAVGAACCFRPVAVVYLVGLLLWLVASNGEAESRLSRWLARPLILVLAALVPMAWFAGYFMWMRAFDDFWRSVVVHTWRYDMPVFTRPFIVRNLQALWVLAPEQAALWLFAGGWAVHAFSMGFRRETGLIALWGSASIVASLLARNVETMHFLQTVPPLAIGAALAVTNPSEKLIARNAQGRLETRTAMLGVFAAALALGFLYTETRAYLQQASRNEMSTDRAAVEVATLIRQRTSWRDRIYVWGTRPQIYVLAKRAAAHPAFYNRELNVDRLRRAEGNRFFSPGVHRDIYLTLVRTPPPFVVTTEEYLPEDIEKLGPIKDWFYFMREHYELWQVVDAKPYAFTIFARKDRLYDQ